MQTLLAVVVLTASTGAIPASLAEQSGRIPPTGTLKPETVAKRQTALTDAVSKTLDDHPGVDTAVMLKVGNTTFQYGGNTRFETASAVKIEILVRWLLLRQHSDLPAGELDLAKAMIEQSDNNATNSLCMAIASRTKPGVVPGGTDVCVAKGQWGTDETTAPNQMKVLQAAFGKTLLTADSRKLVKQLTGSVTKGQAWGVSAADDDKNGAFLKNGWDARGNGWLAHSIGSVHIGKPVRLVILSSGNEDYQHGVAHVETVAKIAREAVVG